MVFNKTLGVYIAKCVTGVLLSSLLSVFFSQWIDYSWSLISVVLVLSPEGTDSVELALTRIKANLVGAAIGVLLLFTLIPAPWNIALGCSGIIYLLSIKTRCCSSIYLGGCNHYFASS